MRSERRIDLENPGLQFAIRFGIGRAHLRVAEGNLPHLLVLLLPTIRRGGMKADGSDNQSEQQGSFGEHLFDLPARLVRRKPDSGKAIHRHVRDSYCRRYPMKSTTHVDELTHGKILEVDLHGKLNREDYE